MTCHHAWLPFKSALQVNLLLPNRYRYCQLSCSRMPCNCMGSAFTPTLLRSLAKQWAHQYGACDGAPRAQLQYVLKIPGPTKTNWSTFKSTNAFQQTYQEPLTIPSLELSSMPGAMKAATQTAIRNPSFQLNSIIHACVWYRQFER